MEKEKFKLINFIRELVVYIDNNLDNFPKKDIELKNRIRNTSYDLLEISYMANTTQDNVYKEKLIEQIITKIKMIDFLLNICYDKQIINSKKYVKFGSKLDDIIKYATGWKNALNKRKKQEEDI